MSLKHSVHANLCIAPIFVYMLPKRALKGLKLNLSMCFDVGQLSKCFRRVKLLLSIAGSVVLVFVVLYQLLNLDGDLLTYKEWVGNDSKHGSELGTGMGLLVSPTETLLSSQLVEYYQDL